MHWETDTTTIFVQIPSVQKGPLLPNDDGRHFCLDEKFGCGGSLLA